MSTEFYDRVAAKNRRYSSGVRYEHEHETGNPEAVFKEKLLDAAGLEETALDIGCADGRFTLEVAPSFKSVSAIDISDGMLEVAEGFRTKAGIANVSFKHANASALPFPDGSFDVAYSRRGPSFIKEYSRVLKLGGYFVEIRIGAEDTRLLKELFGRGQGFGAWNHDLFSEEQQAREAVGFKMEFAERYRYGEFYGSYGDLDKFLQSVPIFEDFDSKKDKVLLEKYVGAHTEKQGIRLDRERYVFVAKRV